jgi:ABC-2 type transport system ATP-binding protein
MRTRRGSASEAVIVVEDVQKRFKDTHALKGVSLTVHRGEFIGLLGPNGAGKTTLIEILEGIQKEDSGRVTLLGRSWHDSVQARELRAGIGLSLQESHFFEKLRVQEILELFASFYGVGPDRVSEVLRLIDLEAKARSYTSHLSGGQRQRLALGVAVLHRPQILFLDEPTTGLDPGARRSLWNILNDLKREGMTMLLTTHYMEEAAVLSDRIFILDQGRFIAGGTLDELIDANGGGYFIHFRIRSVPGFAKAFETKFRGKYMSLAYEAKTGEGTVHVSSSTAFLAAWPSFLKQQKTELLSLEIHRMTLDDLFLALTGRSLLEDESAKEKEEA